METVDNGTLEVIEAFVEYFEKTGQYRAASAASNLPFYKFTGIEPVQLMIHIGWGGLEGVRGLCEGWERVCKDRFQGVKMCSFLLKDYMKPEGFVNPRITDNLYEFPDLNGVLYPRAIYKAKQAKGVEVRGEPSLTYMELIELDTAENRREFRDLDYEAYKKATHTDSHNNNSKKDNIWYDMVAYKGDYRYADSGSLLRFLQDILTEHYDMDKCLDTVYFLASLIGKNASYHFDEETGKQSLKTGKDDTLKVYDSVKHFGKANKLTKFSAWPIIAEKLKHELDQKYDIKYYTNYEDLKTFYMDHTVSGGSCMRHEFTHLPYHPVIAYAHDVEDIVDGSTKLVSDDIKLAVLFKDDVAIARCMVSENDRGSCFGEGASVLSKLIPQNGGGIRGYVNLVSEGAGYIMPYIDGACTVCEETGEIDEGDARCDSTEGMTTEAGYYSEYHDTMIPEDEAVWSDYLDTYLWREESVETVHGDYMPEDHDEVAFSDYNNCHFILGYDDFTEIEGEWVSDDDVDDYCMEKIAELCSETLVEIVNEYC